MISLNSLAASQAVTMFLAAVAGVPMRARSLAIRGMEGTIRVLEDSPLPGCANCSDEGFYGKGSQFALPRRAK